VSKQANRILLIDDDSALLTALSETLHRYIPEVQLDCESNVSGALDQLKRCTYELIICDLRMPLQDGLMLLDAARQADSQQLVMIITGSIEESVVKEAMRRGAVAVVSKPLDRGEFVKIVREALSVRSQGGNAND